MKSKGPFVLIFVGIALIFIAYVENVNPRLGETLGIPRIPSIPNPFQKNISKSVNVTTSMSPWWYDFAAKSCFKTSISKAQLDNLLSNGVKVITMSHWEVVPYAWSDFTCIGYTYVLEGPENLLNKP